MQIGLKLWSTNINYVEEVKKLSTRNVFDYIELFTEFNSTAFIDSWNLLDLPYVLHAPHSYKGLNFSKAELKNGNSSSLDCVNTFFESLHPRYVIFHPGIDGCVEETIEQINYYKVRFPKLFKHALIENKPKYGILGEACIGYSILEIQQIMEKTGIGFCLDFGHAIVAAAAEKISWVSKIEQFIQLKPAMYHLSDGDSNSVIDKHLHLGCGNFDLQHILKLIDENTAMVSLETPKDCDTNLDDFVKDVKFIKEMLK